MSVYMVQGNALAIPLADGCVQLNLFARLPIQLVTPKVSKDDIGLFGKLSGQTLKVRLSSVFARRAVLAPQFINGNAELDLSALALQVRQRQLEKCNGLLLDYAQPVVRQAPTAGVHMDHLCVGQKRVDEIDSCCVSHSQLKTDRVGGRYPISLHHSLNTNMTLSVNHCSQIADLPFFHDYLPTVCGYGAYTLYDI